jgi:hypothetical protein
VYTNSNPYMTQYNKESDSVEERYNKQGMPAMMPGRMDRMDRMDCYTMYPDVYYKVQPHIMVICDEMDSYDCMMPSHEMMEEMIQRLREDVLRVHPELEDYCVCTRMSHSAENHPEAQQFFGGGFFGDFLSILFLQELFHRRGRGRRFRRWWW